VALRSWVVRVGDLLSAAVYIAVVLLASVMALAIGWQVFMRYVFNKPPSWTEELALLCFTWTMLLMLAVGVRQAFHANIDLLPKVLPAPMAQLLERVILLLTALFGAYLAKGGATYVIETATATSAAIAYPIYALHLAAPVCGVLVLWFAIERLIAPGAAPAERTV
jgi:TRAP-type transport system small permease protein